MNNKTTSKWLTYSGSLPFIALSLIIVSGTESIISLSLATELFIYYGAIILAFLGGVMWGQTINSEHRFSSASLIISNTIALLAALCLLLTSPFISLILLLIGFVLALVVDSILLHKGLIAPWFFQLRQRITAIVVSTFIITIVGLLI